MSEPDYHYLKCQCDCAESAKVHVAKLEAERNLYRDSAWKLEARVAELERKQCDCGAKA